MERTNHSEVARLRALIEQENQLMHQMYQGLSSGTAKHDFINARINRMGVHQEALAALVGHEQSMEILCEVINGATPQHV